MGLIPWFGLYPGISREMGSIHQNCCGICIRGQSIIIRIHIILWYNLPTGAFLNIALQIIIIKKMLRKTVIISDIYYRALISSEFLILRKF